MSERKRRTLAAVFGFGLLVGSWLLLRASGELWACIPFLLACLVAMRIDTPPQHVLESYRDALQRRELVSGERVDRRVGADPRPRRCRPRR